MFIQMHVFMLFHLICHIIILNNFQVELTCELTALVSVIKSGMCHIQYS